MRLVYYVLVLKRKGRNVNKCEHQNSNFQKLTQPKMGFEGIVVFPRLCGLTSLYLLNKDEQENYVTNCHKRPSLKERNEEQQYYVADLSCSPVSYVLGVVKMGIW